MAPQWELRVERVNPANPEEERVVVSRFYERKEARAAFQALHAFMRAFIICNDPNRGLYNEFFDWTKLDAKGSVQVYGYMFSLRKIT